MRIAPLPQFAFHGEAKMSESEPVDYLLLYHLFNGMKEASDQYQRSVGIIENLKKYHPDEYEKHKNAYDMTQLREGESIAVFRRVIWVHLNDRKNQWYANE